MKRYQFAAPQVAAALQYVRWCGRLRDLAQAVPATTDKLLEEIEDYCVGCECYAEEVQEKATKLQTLISRGFTDPDTLKQLSSLMMSFDGAVRNFRGALTLVEDVLKKSRIG